jgi:hypothetical protein
MNSALVADYDPAEAAAYEKQSKQMALLGLTDRESNKLTNPPRSVTDKVADFGTRAVQLGRSISVAFKSLLPASKPSNTDL